MLRKPTTFNTQVSFGSLLPMCQQLDGESGPMGKTRGTPYVRLVWLRRRCEAIAIHRIDYYPELGCCLLQLANTTNYLASLIPNIWLIPRACPWTIYSDLWIVHRCGYCFWSPLLSYVFPFSIWNHSRYHQLTVAWTKLISYSHWQTTIDYIDPK